MELTMVKSSQSYQDLYINHIISPSRLQVLIFCRDINPYIVEDGLKLFVPFSDEVCCLLPFPDGDLSLVMENTEFLGSLVQPELGHPEVNFIIQPQCSGKMLHGPQFNE